MGITKKRNAKLHNNVFAKSTVRKKDVDELGKKEGTI